MKKFFGVIAMVLAACLMSVSVVAAAGPAIGLGWVGKSGMANRVTAGFEKGIKALAPDIQIEYQKEMASTDALAKVVAEWQQTKKGMVIIRSNGAKWLGKNPPSIPTFIGGCNHPAQLGAVKNFEAPEGNITGVTYFLPVKTQFDIFQAVLPEMNSVLLLLETDHPSSLIDQEGTKAVCAQLGIEYSEKFCASEAEAIEAAAAMKGKVSTIIIGNQAMLMETADKIVAAAGQTPVVSYSNKAVKLGALCGFVADDGKLGYMLAESLVDVLKKGKSIKDTPIKVDPEPQFFVNSKTAQALGIEIPYSILEAATVLE